MDFSVYKSDLEKLSVFQAPEVNKLITEHSKTVNHLKEDKKMKADVFSFGVILLCMAYLVIDFPEKDINIEQMLQFFTEIRPIKDKDKLNVNKQSILERTNSLTSQDLNIKTITSDGTEDK